MTLIEEIHSRHKAFKAHIAERARHVQPKPPKFAVAREIPNTPYGVPKIDPDRPSPVDLTVARSLEVFGNRRLVRKHDGALTITFIQVTAAKFFETTVVALKSPRRQWPLVRQRQLVMYLCKEMTLQSLPQIGAWFGGRDHTTVLHAIRQSEHLIRTNDKFAADFFALKELLTNAT